MPIERLHVKSLKHFSEVDVTFNEKFNFITGPNGCGKTSILAAVAHCLDWNGEYSRHKENSEYWIDVSEKGRKFRFGLGENFVQAIGYRHDKIKSFVIPPLADVSTPVLVPRTF
jgi:predicted ATP-dependent endonuclease of OLD family